MLLIQISKGENYCSSSVQNSRFIQVINQKRQLFVLTEEVREIPNLAADVRTKYIFKANVNSQKWSQSQIFTERVSGQKCKDKCQKKSREILKNDTE